MSTLTEKAAFQRAFIARCLEAGYTLPQIATAAKQAAWRVKRADPATVAGVGGTLWGGGKALAEGALGLGKYVASKTTPLALGAALLAPPALGYVAGTSLAKATDYDDTDVEEIRQRELADEYKRNIVRLRLSQLARARGMH